MGFNYHTQAQSMTRSERVLMYSSYILLGAASSCIFLILSLRLVPSICGFFLILLHIMTIVAAITGCTAASSGETRWYCAHMGATVLTAIFQGSVCVLIFTNTDNFLGSLKSYVRKEDGSVILKMTGGLSALIFCFDGVVLTLVFFSKFYAYVKQNDGAPTKQQQLGGDDDTRNWP